MFWKVIAEFPVSNRNDCNGINYFISILWLITTTA
jgi:hypothetical protein